MSAEKSEKAFETTIVAILESIGNSAAANMDVIGGNSLKIAAERTEKYAVLLRKLFDEYENTPTQDFTFVSQRLSIFPRNETCAGKTFIIPCVEEEPEEPRLGGSPTNADITLINNESTILDATREMDSSTHTRGFLADESDLNGTVCSMVPKVSLSTQSKNRRRAHILKKSAVTQTKTKKMNDNTLSIFEGSDGSTIVGEDSIIIED